MDHSWASQILGRCGGEVSVAQQGLGCTHMQLSYSSDRDYTGMCNPRRNQKKHEPAFEALTLGIRRAARRGPPKPRKSSVWLQTSVSGDGWCPSALDLSTRRDHMFVLTGQLRITILSPSSSCPLSPPPPHLVERRRLHSILKWKADGLNYSQPHWLADSELLMVKAKLWGMFHLFIFQFSFVGALLILLEFSSLSRRVAIRAST